ncbi:Hsp20/alpha crystallin family protein [Desulfurivibrio alkaliphilus]|uniref:Heat shock protein Hsp20 n=1 Tax=Desulfurivibrio alkaliphilus (strain DSM 19089 / UNIQEM U267 / AHT2) TaxID=589865 RepID=D6Z1L4_DESAT|nr:Hsp20/alpha crystallin family protein [Desulfurivibrio alkaliphilus]ADH85439.1 heat shock protein Hsp20 [Desulfurivibrio alkaliphilus AHT 2]
MDERSKRILLEKGMNRMARELGRRGINPMAGAWSVPTDIFETDQEFVVCLELAGVDPTAIQVIAEETRLTVSGERKYNFPAEVRRVHQLEIERGHFEKRISLPWPIDVAAAGTEFRQGFLVITMPKQRRRVTIPVSAG